MDLCWRQRPVPSGDPYADLDMLKAGAMRQLATLPVCGSCRACI